LASPARCPPLVGTASLGNPHSSGQGGRQARPHSTRYRRIQAKAHRHLGVIARREGRYRDAREQYEIAERVATGITDEHNRLAMKAGLQYALGSLSVFEGDLGAAAAEINEAIQSFTALGDEYRLNMALVLRGDIEFGQGAADDACGTYRQVLENADRIGRRCNTSGPA